MIEYIEIDVDLTLYDMLQYNIKHKALNFIFSNN